MKVKEILSESKIINETSLSRVWQHVKGPRPFALVTAFRGEFTREDNIKRNKKLAADIRNLGYGFFFLDGFWIENQGTPEERKVSEDSLFVVGPQGSDREFIKNMVKLAKENNQDGVLVKSTDGIKIYVRRIMCSGTNGILPIRPTERSNPMISRSLFPTFGRFCRLLGFLF